MTSSVRRLHDSSEYRLLSNVSMHDEPHRHFRLRFIHEINGLCYIQFSLLKYAKKIFAVISVFV